jgi:hypothetical protein
MPRDELYGQCPDCGGSLTHRATDGRCPLRMNNLDMTLEQQQEIGALIAGTGQASQGAVSGELGTLIDPVIHWLEKLRLQTIGERTVTMADAIKSGEIWTYIHDLTNATIELQHRRARDVRLDSWMVGARRPALTARSAEETLTEEQKQACIAGAASLRYMAGFVYQDEDVSSGRRAYARTLEEMAGGGT